MERMKTLLSEIGLSKTEASIYLIGINYPSLGVAELQKLTDIKRPTIYNALHTLTDKGLVGKSGAENRLQFSFTPPEQVKHLIEKRIEELQKKNEELDEILPGIQQLTSLADITITSHYEGIEGVKTAIDIALYCKTKRWSILAPDKNFFSDFNSVFADYFMETRKRRGIVARSLWEKIRGRTLTESELAQRQPRILPESMHGKFVPVIIIFDDKVLIISSAKKLSAILITSLEINQLFLAMFDGLWQQSAPYKQIRLK